MQHEILESPYLTMVAGHCTLSLYQDLISFRLLACGALSDVDLQEWLLFEIPKVEDNIPVPGTVSL